jgi:hypothetical protein
MELVLFSQCLQFIPLILIYFLEVHLLQSVEDFVEFLRFRILQIDSSSIIVLFLL